MHACICMHTPNSDASSDIDVTFAELFFLLMYLAMSAISKPSSNSSKLRFGVDLTCGMVVSMTTEVDNGNDDIVFSQGKLKTAGSDHKAIMPSNKGSN